MDIAVSWIPVEFSLNAPDWILRNNLKRMFTLNLGIKRVFIDPTHPGAIGVVWSSATVLPESYLDGLRTWTYRELENPIANETETENENEWNFSEHRNIPRNSHNAVTMNDIQNGNRMVNFHGRYGYGNYFKKSTYNSLPMTPETEFRKLNPITREPIDENYVQPYTARVVGGRKTQNRRRKTLRRRKSAKA